ncbi:MAG: hypothetical protein QOC62_1830 [Mycobacterium sp.]|jgi:ketosteroid isomerase-like protein|nr:hypothetical protein [Mycobacterium sp.]
MTRESSAEDRTRSVIQQFYEKSLSADLEGLAKVMHPGVVVHEPASVPYGGEHVGRDAVLELIAQLYSLIDLDSVVVGDILVNSERAAAFLELPFDVGGSADNPKMLVVETFVIRDGLIAEITPYYFDTAAFAART